MKDFSNYLFSPHRAGELMVDPRSKKEVVSETTKTYLQEIWIQENYGRKKIITSKYMTKGVESEDDSIQLLSSYLAQKLDKNEMRFKNEYILGTPDVITETSVIDVKTSWDLFTFLKSELTKNYYAQIQCYLDLTNRTHGTLAYCLVDTPVEMVNDEVNKLNYLFKEIDSYTNTEFIKMEKQIRKNMAFSDIPLQDRVMLFEFEKNEEFLSRLYSKIEQCRVWLNEYNPKEKELEQLNF